MAIKYVGVKRVQGTEAERTETSLPAGTVTGWKLVDRTSLSSAADDVHVASLANKRYYMTLTHLLDNGSAIDAYFRFNDDTNNNYYNRQMQRGGADSTNSTDGMTLTGGNASDIFGVQYISNKADKQKLMINPATFYGNGAVSNTAPDKHETAGLWNESSNAINKITVHNYSAGSYDTNSEVVVLGYDPTDTGTNDFWTEITPQGGVKLSSAGDTLTTGTIASYKYLWLQAYVENSNNVAYNVRFNGVAGSDYTQRYNVNGGADPTPITVSDAIFCLLTSAGSSSVGHPMFLNMFIVNVAGKEKLVIGHSVGGSAGAGNAPDRMDTAGKWNNTDAITQIDIVNDVGSADYTTSSVLKVWGAN